MATARLTYIIIWLLWSQILEFGNTQNMSPKANFPPTISIRRGTYQNWSNEITVANVWIATPYTQEDVATLANWAMQNGYKLRPSGYMHGWSPLTITPADTIENILLVDTTKYLVNMKVNTLPNSSKKTVSVETGTTMLDLLTYLEENGLGMYSVPAVGDISVGGVLAINGHGAGIPAVGETVPNGHSYGTLSNMIISLTAVVWDSTLNVYNLKTFQRSDADTKAFLVHLGRAFITEVTLMVGANYNLRCVSTTDISSDELFAKPGSLIPKRTFASFLDGSGRVEAILFPFTDYPWLKVWTISPEKPLLSTQVSCPYNYLFSDNFPEVFSELVGNITNGAWILTPTLGYTQLLATTAGLIATLASDIWGPSKNTLLYVKPTTLRLSENGYAIATKRSKVQEVVNTFMERYEDLINEYANQGFYPLNGPLEIRASSLDQTGTVPNGESPSLSAAHPVKNHPEYDVVVWLNVLSFPNAQYLNEARAKLESFVYSTFKGQVRPEWSKGWAFTNQSVFSNATVYGGFFPDAFPASSASGNDGWNWAVGRLNYYDPYRVFTNEFLDRLLQPV